MRVAGQLVVEHVSKRFGSVQAVDDVSLAVPAGGCVGLVGPNGSGKSTLIRCCVGILKPELGRIEVCGRSMTDGDIEAKAFLGFAPELPDTVSSFTPWDHMVFVARMLELQSWEAEAERLLQAFDIWPKRNHLAQTLSKGEHQKVMLSMAFLRRPQVLFLDEPLLGLDPRASLALKNEVRAAVARGASVVISSHVLSLVEELCPALAVLSKGRLVFWGTPAGLRVAAEQRPGTPLEESFVRLTETGPGEAKR